VTYFKCYKTNPKTQTHGEVVAQGNQELDLTKINVPEDNQTPDPTKINAEHHEIVETKEKYNK